MVDITESRRMIKKSQRRVLALFSLGVFFFWFFEFLFQHYWVSAGQWEEALVRSFAFSGMTLISASLFSSVLFRWVPRLAQYWRIRRYLGVGGFVFIFLHIQAVMKWYFDFNIDAVYFSLNPLINPIVFGSFAYSIFFLMAITSTDWAMQKLTPRVWKVLHRCVYVAYVSAIFHFLLMAPEGMLNNLAGYLLIGLTSAALFGHLYLFFKTIAKKSLYSFGAFVGYVIIAGTLVLAYIIWG